ncbi:MAG: thioredoxin-dependent peroxiredoxin [Thermoplasmata archaeon]|jgi:peroxiredoxin Q/BCP|nr:thioredoxin-dependent peroxiredoxin [Thermoplasmata archaeon]
MLRNGDAAPDFVLKDADGRDVRLSSFSGRPIILYFYPKDHTPGCTLQAKDFRDHYAEIAEHGAVVVGVSLDDVESHCGFRDRHGLPFALLADPDGRVHDLYEAWRTTLFGRSSIGVRRCTFLIGPDGVIRKAYPRVRILGHARQVIGDLERLRAQEAWGKGSAETRELLKP